MLTRDPPGKPPPSKGALRKRRERARHRMGLRVLDIETNYFRAVEALIASTRLTDVEALDQKNVEAALGEVVAEWANLWLDQK